MSRFFSYEKIDRVFVKNDVKVAVYDKSHKKITNFGKVNLQKN